MRTTFCGFAVLAVTILLTHPAPAQDWNTLITGDAVTGYTVKGATNIDVQTARSLFDQKVPFVDFRSKRDWAEGHIPGAIRCGNATESNISSIVPKHGNVVFYCSGPDCRQSVDATAMAIGWGFTNIHHFAAGYPAWEAAQLPVETAQ